MDKPACLRLSRSVGCSWLDRPTRSPLVGSERCYGQLVLLSVVGLSRPYLGYLPAVREEWDMDQPAIIPDGFRRHCRERGRYDYAKPQPVFERVASGRCQ